MSSACIVFRFRFVNREHFFGRRFIEILSEQRNTTKENVQRKQARIEGERGDSDAEGSASDSDEDEDDDIPYNPKNLPLGWDGKVRRVNVQL